MPQQNTSFNNGAPLSQDQIQQLRTKVGIKAPAGQTASADTSSQWGAYDKLTGRTASAASASSGMNLGIADTAKGGIENIKSGVSDLFPQFSHANDATYAQQGADVRNATRGGGIGAGIATAGAQMGENAMHGVAGLGKVVGGVAQTALSPILGPVSKIGGAIGDQIGHAVPEGAAQKFYELLKNHPEIGKYATDVMNMANLAVPEAAEKGAPVVDSAITGATDAAKAGVSSVSNAARGATEGVVNTARDAATSMTPNMQTLIDRVKSNPEEAAKTADLVKSYFQTAENGKGVTGAATPLDQAGGQFKTAMGKLRTNMKTAGETMSNSLAQVAGAKASGINGILDFLKNETENRLGAQYTPMAEQSNAMDGMNFAKRTKYLNDIIDGKEPSPFGSEEGVFQSAPGREIAVSSASDLKKLADLHETLQNLGDSPSVQQIHDTVQRLQSDLYKSRQPGAEPIDSNVQGLMKQVSGMLNEQAKTAATAAEKESGLPEGQYADAKSKYSELADLQENMSRRLGKEFRQAPSLIKKIFSPQNQGLNPLVAKLEKETGIPILDHATLADFAMRSVGDPRIKSMLEQVQSGGLSKKALTSKLINYIGEKLQDPEGKALRQLSGKPSLTDKVTNYAKNVQPGLSMKNLPMSIAKNLNGRDVSLVQDFVNNPDSFNAWMKLGDSLPGMGLDKMTPDQVHGILSDAVTLRNNPDFGSSGSLGKSLVKGSGDPRTSLPAAIKNLATSGTDWDRAIESGDIPRTQIYKTDGSFTPKAADHVVADLAGKMNMFKKGLGDAFKKAVDMKKSTRENLVSQATAFMKKQK